ncbi:cytochrome c biogenesis protein CcsA [Dysgonomonas sp. Marseille-P4677]|uniref:cytochrome c biogenesis protein CcsA n=1 Tax=Dysgonomonas sp. Marseille-P4677 TaxID=2364790 RepID=UPI001911CE00|nr:cytochrome c biogenesis protein CcsA [Dysgonomonas sp. Marseille-P4677]MBK5721742.1 cytochrome c biogenesis protein CcsA [Dysgonomonas sp. Marseille-P4677]
MDIKSKTESIISSYRTTIVLLLIYAFIMAMATLIEKYMGTAASKTIVYYSPLFFLVQIFLIVNFIGSSLKHRLFSKGKWGFIVVHLAFVVVLTGAMITHIFSEEGVIHLRENGTSNRMIIETNKSKIQKDLPFKLELKKFTLTRYPGSSSPSSFESDLIIHLDGKSVERKISMNNIIDIEGYRLFQASYDKDEKGTILSVNKDVAGRNVTYTGYALLLIGFILCFIGKNTRFHQLSKRLKELKALFKTTAIICILILTPLFSNAQNKATNIFEAVQKNSIDKEHAALFGALPIQSTDGRIEPINTFSSEILRKLHHSETIGNMNSDQFLLSMLTLSEMWMHIPFITQKNKEISSRFTLSENACAYIELFDDKGNYKLQKILDQSYGKSPSERNKFDKDLIKLDEKINIFHQLINYKMLNIFPKADDHNHKWYSPADDLNSFSKKDSLFVSSIFPQYLINIQDGIKTDDWEKAYETLRAINIYQQERNTTLGVSSKKINTELIYNKLDIFRLCKKFYLILGGLLLAVSFISLFKKQKYIVWITRILLSFICICFLFHLSGIGMRWYIGGYAPWSNSYETMIYVSSISVLAGLIFVRQNTIICALSTLFGGVILFVSGLNWMDPQIGTLVPVLKSPWLMFHVAVIVAAYGFFGLSFLLGATNLSVLSFYKKNKTLVIKNHVEELSIVNEMSLWIGLALMTIGTFLGAIWANESWGRYWGWDPKETWALITIIVYTVVTHLRLVKKWNTPWHFNLFSIIAFASVLMTYFGVNYLLSGMHSYG